MTDAERQARLNWWGEAMVYALVFQGGIFFEKFLTPVIYDLGFRLGYEMAKAGWWP